MREKEKRTISSFNYTKKEAIYLIVALSFLIFTSFFIPQKTGNVFDIVGVSIKEKTDISVFLDYISQITIYDTQNISLIAMNTGSKDYDARLQLYIYNLSNHSLNLTATYSDSTVHLYPGNTRDFNIIFNPPSIGTFYIKGTVSYGSRLTEVWGVFVVGEIEYQNQTNQTNQTTPPPSGGAPSTGSTTIRGPVNIFNVIVAPKLSLEYPSNLTLYVNSTVLLPIKVTNTGNYSAESTILFLSTPNKLTTDINPKTPQNIVWGGSVLYLVSIEPWPSVTGNFTISFEVTSKYVKSIGSTQIFVIDYPQNKNRWVCDSLLDYEYMITEVQAEIEIAGINGYNISVPKSYIDKSYEELVMVKEYCQASEYDTAAEYFKMMEGDLMQAVFTLGNLQLPVVIKAEFPYIWIFVLVISLGILFLIAFWKRRKKRNRRPRFLEKSSEE